MTDSELIQHLRNLAEEVNNACKECHERGINVELIPRVEWKSFGPTPTIVSLEVKARKTEVLL